MLTYHVIVDGVSIVAMVIVLCMECVHSVGCLIVCMVYAHPLGCLLGLGF